MPGRNPAGRSLATLTNQQKGNETMSSKDLLHLSRRRILLAGGVMASGLAAPAVWTSARAQSRRIVVRDPGGPFSNAFKVAFFEPFKKETGVEVVGVSSANEPVSQIKGIVQSGAKTWDIAGGISMATVHQLKTDGDYIEPHRLDDDPVIKEIPAEFRNELAIGVEVYTTALGYRTDKYKDKAPKTWADFFNVAEFPGRRAMRKNPADTLEIALFADGVTKDQMYPLDIERAFRKLATIKPHVSAWWTSGAQATQMLATGEVDMIPTWSSRSAAAAEQGAPIAISYDNNIWGTDVWAILKGGANVEICREFIRFASDAKRQAALAPFIVNGPTNPNAYKHIDEARAKLLTTNPAYRGNSLQINDAFWAANRDKVAERFNAWLLT